MHKMKEIFTSFSASWLLNSLMGLVLYYIFIIDLGNDGFSKSDMILISTTSGLIFLVSISIVNTLLLKRHHFRNSAIIGERFSSKKLFLINLLGILFYITLIDSIFYYAKLLDFTEYTKAFNQFADEISDTLEGQEVENPTPFYISVISNVIGVCLGIIASIFISNKLTTENGKKK